MLFIGLSGRRISLFAIAVYCKNEFDVVSYDHSKRLNIAIRSLPWGDKKYYYFENLLRILYQFRYMLFV